MRHRNGYRMSRRNTTIASVLAGLLLVAAAGCGGGHHQATPPTSSTTSTTTTSSTTAPVTTSPLGTTTTTVLGPSGPASSYPAAQANPPSLACAYPTGTTVNLIAVLKCLTTYRDWVWSHPDPTLVPNYLLAGSSGATTDANLLSQLKQQGLHASPTPTVINFARISRPATPTAASPPASTPPKINGYAEFSAGLVVEVTTVASFPLLTTTGAPSGKQFTPSQTGQLAYLVDLSQAPDGQFVENSATQLNPPGGIASLEDQK
jgi:hypothetical protein